MLNGFAAGGGPSRRIAGGGVRRCAASDVVAMAVTTARDTSKRWRRVLIGSASSCVLLVPVERIVALLERLVETIRQPAVGADVPALDQPLAVRLDQFRILAPLF